MPEIGQEAKAREIGKPLKGLYIWTECPNCHMQRWIQKGFLKRQTIKGLCGKCSQRHRETHPCWKGGKHYDRNGYVLTTLQPDNFFFSMAKPRHYILEHRLVMAQHLGRCLHPWEIVHHRNGKRDDNRIENLQLISELGHKQLGQLETEIQKLQEEIRLLRWQIKELIDAAKTPIYP